VRHREHPFRGVVFDVDPEFANTEEWYESIPEESRPSRNQPFYHLYAETEATYYVAYVSEQNLLPDIRASRWTIPKWWKCSANFRTAAIRCSSG
jgi:heat shock protein HspQ